MGPLHTSICRWGNSRGVCLPESVLSLVGLTDHDEVALTVSNDSIIISKAVPQRTKDYPSLKERFSTYTGDYTPEEWATGPSVGEEI